MTIEISEIIDPMPLPVRPENVGRPKSPLSIAVEALPVGKAIIVSGMGQKDLHTRLHSIGKRQAPRRRFSCREIGDGRYQITRKS